MLSPFPGMDPYLEGPLWMSIHEQLIVEIAHLLSPRLRPDYIVRTPKHYQTSMPEAMPLRAIEIHHLPSHRLATAIEVLSPTDKRGEGRAEYLIRRKRFLVGSTHLMEIDLLRGGARPATGRTAASRSLLHRLEPCRAAPSC